MANIEKANEANHQTTAATSETAAPQMPFASDRLRKMVASGKSVPTKASAK